jgi:SAM-dependent methyltransferase
MRGVPRLRPLAKGVASFVVPQLRTSHGYDNPLGTGSAESCYSIFLRHLCLIQDAGVRGVPEVVAELGPGSSLGVGLAALLAGAERYYALDLIDHSDAAANLAVFDRLVEMFRNRTPIPASGVHSLRFPDLDDYAYPKFLAAEDTASFERRAAAIRRDIASAGGEFVRIAAPWTEASVVQRHSVDWIFSQSVLEHIDDLEGVYSALGQWLRPAAHMSHLIDFDSHGKAREWNGHWAVGDLAWAALRGRRPYLINRAPYAEYVRLAQANGFTTVLEKRNKRFDGLLPEQFAPRFRSITDEDARLRMVLAISRSAAP